MKKLLILAIALCGMISANAEEPKTGQTPAQEAKEHCAEFKLNAVPSTKEDAHFVINRGNNSDNKNENSSNWDGNGKVGANVTVLSGEIGGSYNSGNTNTQGSQSQSKTTSYYQCK